LTTWWSLAAAVVVQGLIEPGGVVVLVGSVLAQAWL
jgi:predicted S18 family serine protease